MIKPHVKATLSMGTWVVTIRLQTATRSTFSTRMSINAVWMVWAWDTFIRKQTKTSALSCQHNVAGAPLMLMVWTFLDVKCYTPVSTFFCLTGLNPLPNNIINTLIIRKPCVFPFLLGVLLINVSRSGLRIPIQRKAKRGGKTWVIVTWVA